MLAEVITASPSRRSTNQYNQSHQSLPSQQTDIPLTLNSHGDFSSRHQQAHFSSSSYQYQHGYATHNKSDSQIDISSSSYQHGYAAQSKIVSPRRSSEGCAMSKSASPPAIHNQHGHTAMHKSASPPALQEQQGYATSHGSASQQRNGVPGGKSGTDEGESLMHHRVCTVLVYLVEDIDFDSSTRKLRAFSCRSIHSQILIDVHKCAEHHLVSFIL